MRLASSAWESPLRSRASRKRWANDSPVMLFLGMLVTYFRKRALTYCEQESSVLFAMRIGLVKLLLSRGISQSEFARQIGRSPSFVNRVLAGKEAPSQETINAILSVLHVPYEEAFLGAGEAVPANVKKTGEE